MAEATVKTVQYIDKRIEPQPDPLYDNVIGPTQNQFYKIAASALSNSSIHFNNLTTLGADRAYLDTFEIELTCDIDFLVRVPTDPTNINVPDNDDNDHREDTPYIAPLMCDWVFDSFPFNKCCEEVRVNINGGGFFSQPLSYVRAKERYMNQRALSRSYENICPIHRPMLQYESGRVYTNISGNDTKNLVGNDVLVSDQVGHAGTSTAIGTLTTNGTTGTYTDITTVKQPGGRYYDHNSYTAALPSRYGRGMMGMLQSECMLDGGVNNSIVRTGVQSTDGNSRWSNIRVGTVEVRNGEHYMHVIYTVTWREPIFCSPFSSRYDATFGRPLYNITSMDLTFTLQNLGNMIRIQNVDYGLKGFVSADTVNRGLWANRTYVKDYNINILSAQLCYQVMTIPPTITKPLSTLVPYRRFVPYITDFPQNPNAGGQNEALPLRGGHIQLKSGVYTLNEIPTAIWVFCAPSKSRYQENAEDCSVTQEGEVATYVPEEAVAGSHNHYALNTGEGNWDSNKLFAFMEHINISMANTTQILNTAEPVDLYRIAKYNGCEDSYLAWGVYDACAQKPCETGVATYRTIASDAAVAADVHFAVPRPNYYGPGSVLRLIPGQDLIIPGEALIPGANAKNMVFQCEGNFYIPPHTLSQNRYALWLLFEYVGVAAISPGQCEITMNPLGDGSIMDVSPVMSGTSDESEGVLDDIGGRGNINKAARIAAAIGESGIISRVLRLIPGAKEFADLAAKHGLGQPGSKRSKGCGVSGGAVIGQGMKDWV